MGDGVAVNDFGYIFCTEEQEKAGQRSAEDGSSCIAASCPFWFSKCSDMIDPSTYMFSMAAV